MVITWNEYRVVAFIDSNVALECLALNQLPWREIHDTGPILVLVVPTVLQEVDSKKTNSRLGDHARRFNKTIRPLLSGQSTVVIRPAPTPKVELALADCGRVDWELYPDLDPNEPDSKVIAQALIARGPSMDCRLVISHDIRPLYLAKQHGLGIYHVSDNWLRPKERSESEKKADSLTREIEAMKSRQPSMNLTLRSNHDSVSLYRIKTISEKDREVIKDTIVDLNPMPVQRNNSNALGIAFFDRYDHTLSDRYERWKSKIIPQFVREYERKIELNFGQIEIVFRIENVGQVPAESLLIKLSVEGGWLNTHYVLASASGPSSPRKREHSPFPLLRNLHGVQSILPPGKHEFAILKEPSRSMEVQIACADFRHGYDYEYRMIGWVDPHADEFRLKAVVTASNLYGEISETLTVGKTTAEVSVFELVDRETLEFRESPEILEFLRKKILDIDDFEFDGSGWDK